jgi:hypothetical protein
MESISVPSRSKRIAFNIETSPFLSLFFLVEIAMIN